MYIRFCNARAADSRSRARYIYVCWCHVLDPSYTAFLSRLGGRLNYSGCVYQNHSRKSYLRILLDTPTMLIYKTQHLDLLNRMLYSSASLQYLVDQAYSGNPTISEPKPCTKSSIFSSYHHHCASTCCWRTDCNIIKKWICEVKDCSWACYFSVACAATSAPRTQTRTRDTRVSRGKRSVHACAAADN